MPLTDEEAEKVNIALKSWRQGDIVIESSLEFLFLADISRPLSSASQQISNASKVESDVATGPAAIFEEVAGFVMLTQTCDIVRDCRKRPYVEGAPLVEKTADELKKIRRLEYPAFAFVPGASKSGLAADLDRTMTLEKTLITDWKRHSGWETDNELRDFVLALSRKRSRFAFPDDFVEAAAKLQRRIVDKHDKQSDEGAYLQALAEIRVRAAPSWDSEKVFLSWWFIKDGDPQISKTDWSDRVDQWVKLFATAKRFETYSSIVCRLEDMTARDYVESDRLDLDRLSAARE